MKSKFDKSKFCSMKYYGYQDLSSGFFVSNVIDNLQLLEENIDSFNEIYEDLDDFYLYLWLLSFGEMVKELEYYKIDDVKNRIRSLNSKIDYSPKNFICYINEKYKIIFCKEENDSIR